MGELADLILEGALCQQCGHDFMESSGYPRLCSSCSKPARPATKKPAPPATKKHGCVLCPRKFSSTTALADHTRAAHSEKKP